MITGFILSILCIAMMIGGFIAPRYYDVFIPATRREEGTEATIANETKVDHVEVVEEEVKRSGSA